MSAIYEAMSPGGHETYATSIFSKIKTYLDSNPYGYVSKSGDTMTGNLTAPKFIGALQGNADTATSASKLGSSNVGSATQPIYLNGGTATACTYTLGKSVPSDAVFTDHYAWTDITGKPSTFTPSTHYHYELKSIGDQRRISTTPDTYLDRIIFQGLKLQSYIGNPGGTTGYSYLLGLRGWGDSSGGDAHELAFNNKGIYCRHGATTTWGDWSKIFTSADTYTGALTSSQVTSALGFTPTANTGTITSVKTTAGAHTAINVTSGAANFNVPTKTSHLTNDSGFVTTDTKNTAGSTDTSSKIFLIGATSQAANTQTYSQDTAYVGTDGCLYSGGTKVLTAHQDISGKADKSATVSTVAWSNNKLTKTINGTTSDVVSAATILGNLTSSQVTTALGYVPGPSYEFKSSDDSINISASMVPGSETIDLKLNSVSWNNISGKPSTFAPSAHDHNYLVSAGTNTQSTSSTAYALGAFNVRFFSETGKIPGQPSQWGFLLTTATGTSSGENHQIFMAQANGDLYHRGTNASSSSSPPAFKTILDSSNYTSFTRNSSGVIKVNSVTKTPTNAGTSLASPTPIIDSGYKFLCWLYVQSNGYIVGANYPGGAANPSATWWFANGYLANYGLTFYYLEIKDTI